MNELSQITEKLQKLCPEFEWETKQGIYHPCWVGVAKHHRLLFIINVWEYRDSSGNSVSGKWRAGLRLANHGSYIVSSNGKGLDATINHLWMKLHRLQIGLSSLNPNPEKES
jgi:hypothetical protein